MVTEDEHRLIQRYREQARAYNEGIAAAVACINGWDPSDPVGLADAVAKLRKETP